MVRKRCFTPNVTLAVERDHKCKVMLRNNAITRDNRLLCYSVAMSMYLHLTMVTRARSLELLGR